MSMGNILKSLDLMMYRQQHIMGHLLAMKSLNFGHKVWYIYIREGDNLLLEYNSRNYPIIFLNGTNVLVPVD